MVGGERDYKRETKGRSASYVRKLDGDLAAVVRVLAADGTLEERHKDHALTGNWKDHRDCHVRNDLVLIYRKPMTARWNWDPIFLHREAVFASKNCISYPRWDYDTAREGIKKWPKIKFNT